LSIHPYLVSFLFSAGININGHRQFKNLPRLGLL
jgi:hypothetical protein